MSEVTWAEIARSEPFLNRLIQARMDAGLTQMQAARMMGFSNVTLSRYECGARILPRWRLAAFARMYGVTEAWIIDGTPSLSDTQIENIKMQLRGIPAETIQKAIDLLKTMDGVEKDRG